MKKFFKNKKRLLFICLIVMVSLTACSSPRGSDGKTKVNEIIASETFEVQKKNVNVTEIPEEMQAEYENLSDDDYITIEATSFGDAMNTGWFNGLIVWPIAQLINWIAGKTDAGFGIIGATCLIQLLVFAFTVKSQVSSQRMQMLQPELQKIQNKYAGKTDDRSRMMQAQEMQALYKKNNISPFGSILVMFIPAADPDGHVLCDHACQLDRRRFLWRHRSVHDTAGRSAERTDFLYHHLCADGRLQLSVL